MRVVDFSMMAFSLCVCVSVSLRISKLVQSSTDHAFVGGHGGCSVSRRISKLVQSSTDHVFVGGHGGGDAACVCVDVVKSGQNKNTFSL